MRGKQPITNVTTYIDSTLTGLNVVNAFSRGKSR
jgi:hypothetical protein